MGLICLILIVIGVVAAIGLRVANPKSKASSVWAVIFIVDLIALAVFIFGFLIPWLISTSSLPDWFKFYLLQNHK